MPTPIKIPEKVVSCSDCLHSEKFTLQFTGIRSSPSHMYDRYICMYDKDEEVLIGTYATAIDRTCPLAQYGSKNRGSNLFMGSEVMLLFQNNDPK